MTEHGTAIEWTHIPGYKGETWNPVTGCDRVSPGCAHCYALTLAARLKRMGQPKYQRDGDPGSSGPGFGVTLHPDALAQPERWDKPRAVFVNSMSDLFHEDIPDEFIATVFGRMAAARRHIFLILTKRPERMAELLTDPEFENVMRRASGEMGHQLPLPNVWLGVSIENRRFVDRAAILGEIPAAVRFISAEPLLGPLIAESITVASWAGGERVVRTDQWKDDYRGRSLPFYNQDGEHAFHWLIAGGESGPQHRPLDLDWVRDLRDVCQHEGVPFFFKQVGGIRPTSGGRELDAETWSEFPDAAAREGAVR
jgi:protein gp37